MPNTKLLFLGSSPSMLSKQSAYNEKFQLFSRCFSGHIITPVFSESDMKVKELGTFQVHPFPYIRKNSVVRTIYSSVKIAKAALKLFYTTDKYEVIVSPNPLVTGLLAIFLSKLTDAKVIIEVHGNFESAFRYESERIGLAERIKEKISLLLVPLVLQRADAIKLLYRDQLEPLRLDLRCETIVFSFPDFVPVSEFLKAEVRDEKYILLLGYPWYLKGVDILIKAFKKISTEFPAYKVKVVGWCHRGREYFEGLARDNPQIELCEPVYYDKVVELMAGCTVYVLASRTEGIPRVLIEAMACKKPIVASDVGGVTTVVRDRFNGLIFEKENIDELASKLRLILSNKELALRLGENGYRYVKKHFSEEVFLDRYNRLIETLVEQK